MTIIMGRRNDHSREEIRALALNAAETLIRQQGLTGLSARKIAQDIGYTVGSLYNVFKNLDDLILHVNARTLDELQLRLQQEPASDDTPQAELYALAHAYLNFALHDTHRWRAIFDHSLTQPDEVIPDWYRAKIAELFSLVEIRLQALQPQHDCAVLARALWSSVHGICLLAVREQLQIVGVTSHQALLDVALDTFFRGIRK